MIETEKAILAVVIQFPNLLDFLLRNYFPGMFLDISNQAIFETLSTLNEGKISIDWMTVRDVLRGKVREFHFVSMIEALRGLPDSQAENFLKEKLALIKKAAGQKAVLKAIQEEASSPFVDFSRIIEAAEKGRLVETIRESSSFQAAYQDYVSWKAAGPSNIGTGLPSFDREIGGFHPGEIVGIMGRAATAKTFLGLNILSHLLPCTTKRIAFFTLEMSKAALTERLLQIYFDKSRHALEDEKITERLEVQEFLSRFSSLGIYSRVYSVAEISDQVKKAGLEIIFIDHLQLVRQTQGRSLYEKATYDIRELKELAKNQDVVIFLLIQISRKGEGGWTPVTLDMARDSGAIEENVDFLIGIWNPSLEQNADPKWRGKLSLKLLKNKRGPVFGVRAYFSRESGKIMEIDENGSQLF
jgi:replicative DNA helicase